MSTSDFLNTTAGNAPVVLSHPIPGQDHLHQVSGSMDAAIMPQLGGISSNFDPSSEWELLSSQGWPSEIWDSMTWSAQFFDAIQNP